MSPPRPTSVPETAIFDDNDQLWELGERDAEARKIGVWTYWRPDGSKECEETWGDGRTRLTYRRFHPDGSVAHSGAKDLVRDLWVGRPRWTRIEGESPEHRHWPVSGTPAARAYEMTIDDDGWVVDERLFDAAGNRITQGGAPFPPIPEGLPDNVFLTSGDRLWVSQSRSLDNARRRGAYAVWDRNGVLQERQQYDDAGAEKPLRREQYKSGALWSLLEQRGAERVQSFFRRRDGGEPVLRSSTIYRDGDRDREETLYDEHGVRRYSVRMEEVAPGHVRRYDDGQLVFEAIWTVPRPRCRRRRSRTTAKTPRSWWTTGRSATARASCASTSAARPRPCRSTTRPIATSMAIGADFCPASPTTRPTEPSATGRW